MSTTAAVTNPIIEQYKFHSKKFTDATTGWNEADAESQIGKANKVKWLTGHLVSTRYLIAWILGMQEMEPYGEIFAQGKGAIEGTKYPTMAELTKDWDDISNKVLARLESMTEADWDAPGAPFPLPMADGTRKGSMLYLISFHEAYTIGQIGYARRMHNMDAVK